MKGGDSASKLQFNIIQESYWAIPIDKDTPLLRKLIIIASVVVNIGQINNIGSGGNFDNNNHV
jgi:hypothetical protein